MPTSFEYPSTSDLSDEGYSVFDKNNLAESIVMLRFWMQGIRLMILTLIIRTQFPEKVRRVVYDKDDKETYRNFLDTLLFEHCAVYVTTLDGKLMVKGFTKQTLYPKEMLQSFFLKKVSLPRVEIISLTELK